MKKILVTGGLGYIGARVSKYLIENTDYEVIITTQKQNAVPPEWLKNGKIISVDLSSSKEIDAACDGIHTILHLAAMNEIECVQNPLMALEVNVGNTIRLLHAAETKVNRFVYFSTAHVYGAPLRGAISEKTLPRPVHPYAITHRAAEDFVLAAHNRAMISGVVLRLSNGFGVPGNVHINRWSLIVNDLCRQIAEKGEMALKSSGTQIRDFITLFDVCRATEHVIELDGKMIGDGLFNLGGESSMQIMEIAELIACRCEKIFGFKPILNKKMEAVEVQEIFEYGISKLKQTGFKLKKNIEQELDETLYFCKKHFSQ